MAKKNSNRKPSGAAGIAVIDDEQDDAAEAIDRETNGRRSESDMGAAKPARKARAKPEPSANGHFGVGEIKKAAAFANSIGGLDKALALLQILKVAKEVQ